MPRAFLVRPHPQITAPADLLVSAHLFVLGRRGVPRFPGASLQFGERDIRSLPSEVLGLVRGILDQRRDLYRLGAGQPSLGEDLLDIGVRLDLLRCLQAATA
jgi:hypothetical protein